MILTTYKSWDDPPSAKKDGCEASWLDILTIRPLIRYTWRISPWPLLERQPGPASVVTLKGSVLEGKSPKNSGKSRLVIYFNLARFHTKWPANQLAEMAMFEIGVWWYSSNIPAICTIEVTCDVNQQGDVYKGPWALDVVPESFALRFVVDFLDVWHHDLPSLKLCTWKWMVGIQSVPCGMAYVQGAKMLFTFRVGKWYAISIKQTWGNVRWVFLFQSFRFAWIFSLVKVYPLSQLAAKCVYLYTLRKTNMTGWKMDRHEWRCISHWGEYPANFFCCQGWKKQMIVLKW